MSESVTVSWWRDSASELGIKMMDRLIAPDASWDDLLETGRRDIQLALSATGMKTGRDRTLLELGCGMGRLSFALADHFGEVLGTDVAPALIAKADSQNNRTNVQFECGDGYHTRPQKITQFDSVFSYEVFYLLPPEIIRTNLQDVFSLLRPGGELVFEINVVPFSFKTRMSLQLRRLLYAFGIQEWRGWPNAPGFCRYPHNIPELRSLLEGIGYQIDRIIDKKPQQTWFIATKPQT